MLRTVLMILAVICFVLSACHFSTWRADRDSLTAAGLAFFALAVLLRQ